MPFRQRARQRQAYAQAAFVGRARIALPEKLEDAFQFFLRQAAAIVGNRRGHEAACGVHLDFDPAAFRGELGRVDQQVLKNLGHAR